MQTVVVGLVVFVATAASMLALGLVVDSTTPFDHAFAAEHGADVVATIDPSRVTRAELTGADHVSRVTAVSGPLAEVELVPVVSHKGGASNLLQAITVAGRASPGGSVDDLTMMSGHWVQGPGQLVLAANQTGGVALILPVGSVVTAAGVPGAPKLTVVGIASSVTDSAGGWVASDEIAALSSPRTPVNEEVLYRFKDAADSAAIRKDVGAVSSKLPDGTITATESWLAVRAAEISNITPFVPFLAAFGLIAVVLSVLIVANVVSGAVVSGYRRIGILKSIGFTPGQVTLCYAVQMALPAVAGCLLGVLVGNLLAESLLGKAGSLYGVGTLGVPVWVDIVVPAFVCASAALAAAAPALRAGRMSSVQAIANGRAPRTGRGFTAHRTLGRLSLPRPITIGLAAPFSRPSRSAVTLVAIVLGATAVTFAIGLGTSLQMVTGALSHHAEQVEIDPATQPAFNEASQKAVSRALLGEPATLRYVAEADETVSVDGISQSVPLTAFRGEAGWTGYAIVSGRWYSVPGEVDVASGLLRATGKSVGDALTIEFNGQEIRTRIVGAVFDTTNDGISMFTDWRTLSAVDLTLMPGQYDIGLRAGASVMTYSQSLINKLGSKYSVTLNGLHSDVLPLVDALIAILTLLLATVAAFGVLNIVVIMTSERVHDLGVFKAIGMTPRQTIAMIVSWVAGIGLLAGVLGVPAGIALHRDILPIMASAAGGALPARFVSVYRLGEMVALALAGVVIAIAGAVIPASWAASSATATALRAE
ncbi:MAG: FtsX-like permease family protein [Acidimicrobiales bacterium]